MYGCSYICGIGGSDYVSGQRLRPGGDSDCQEKVHPDPKRLAAAHGAITAVSKMAGKADPEVVQACMRPCAPDAIPIMGGVPGIDGAYIACGHNCWCVGVAAWVGLGGLLLSITSV